MALRNAFADLATEDKVNEAVELLSELVARIAEVSQRTGALSPDAAGRLRVNAEVLANIATITTVTTVTTVGTVTTMANQTNIGGLAANQHMIALTLSSEADLRRNVVIS